MARLDLDAVFDWRRRDLRGIDGRRRFTAEVTKVRDHAMSFGAAGMAGTAAPAPHRYRMHANRLPELFRRYPEAMHQAAQFVG